jgi:hypothetical protein
LSKSHGVSVEDGDVLLEKLGNASEDETDGRRCAQGEDDAADSDADHRPDLEQLETDGSRLGACELGALKTEVAEKVEKYVGD